jgi:hypothetical protein
MFHRTQAFFYVHVVILVSEMVAPVIGVMLLDAIGPHFTFLVGIPFKALGFIALLLIKENSASRHEILDDSQADDSGSAPQGKIVRPWTNLIRYLRNDIGDILNDRAVLLGLLVLPVQKLSRPMLELILQYMSFKFGWPLSRVSEV